MEESGEPAPGRGNGTTKALGQGVPHSLERGGKEPSVIERSEPEDEI